MFGGAAALCSEGLRLTSFLMETLPSIDQSDTPRQATMIHIGRTVPKALRKAGYREVSAMHLGNNCWMLTLERGVSQGEEATTDSSKPKNESF